MRNLEINLLLQAIKEAYGYDFTEYKMASLKRRLDLFLSSCAKEHISELIPLVLHNPDKFVLLVNSLTIGITEMFRDPPLYNFIRKEIVPELKTFPSVNIWGAGCSTGQEIYSLAILLFEEGLYSKSRIYGTDINPGFLAEASEGIYPQQNFAGYSTNYLNSGGKASLNNYIHVKYGKGIVDDSIRKNVSFFKHNLVSDQKFIEAQLIFCSNVLIYFNQELQKKVFRLFYDSLHSYGFLVLGPQERIPDHLLGYMFEKISPSLPIYKKK